MNTATVSAPLLTSQVARILGVSSEMVRVLERSGRLPAVKTAGGVRLFDPREVERLAQRRSAAPVGTGR
jgi:excisionase family DNA binding protein